MSDSPRQTVEGPYQPAQPHPSHPLHSDQGNPRFSPAVEPYLAKLDALLEDLPPGIPILPPEDASNFEKYTHRPPRVYARGDGWKNCARALEAYDAELCKGYREEIDTLLVFAGLFSAVVTAFTIESYQWLQADANDAIVVLLSQIALSVSHNGTASSLVPASAALPGSVSVRINTYWFLALALSLSAALVAILCKQWIREFERKVDPHPRYAVAIHQLKLEGLETWRVGAIISLLPLLLQLGLALFALGILELLWQLHFVVAAVVCFPTSVAVLFYAATTILPAIQLIYLEAIDPMKWWLSLFDCPYKSPQALLVFPIVGIYLWTRDQLYVAYHHLVARFHSQDAPYRYIFPFRQRVTVPQWPRFSLMVMHRLDHLDDLPANSLPHAVYRGLHWIENNLSNEDVWDWVWRCLWELSEDPNPPFQDWRHKSRRLGLSHVICGANVLIPGVPCALALRYLLASPAGGMSVAEACIQNLGKLDIAGAEGLLAEYHIHRRIDSQAAVALIRVASQYLRVRMHEPIGDILASLTKLAVECSDAQLRRILSTAVLCLSLNWLGFQPSPLPPATVEATKRMAIIHCESVLTDPDDYGEHPEHLPRRPGVRQLAELLRIYSHTLGGPGRWDAAVAIAETLPYYEPYEPYERPIRIIRALLEIDISHDDRDDIVPSHGEAAVQRVPDPSDTDALNPELAVIPGLLQRGTPPQDTGTKDESFPPNFYDALAMIEHQIPRAVPSFSAGQQEPARADDSARPTGSTPVLRCATMHTDHEADNGRPRVENLTDARLITEDRGDTMHLAAPLHDDVEDLT